MSLDEILTRDLTSAIRSRDSLCRDVLRMVRNAIKYEEINKGRNLEDPEVIQVLQRQRKQHEESITEFRRGNREDLVLKESAELEIISRYLPALMSRNEIVLIATQMIEELGASGPTGKGKVMGALMGQLRGKADGDLVNEVVTELLG